ncbi:MAG TPA: protein kinase [Pyrinomonadaceae bacterium]|nr:protein kinase [Pyrinomonadaceae bacterium]
MSKTEVTPERWRQIKELFRTALAQPQAARALFLDRACDGDDSLRREVESLLASFEGADSFLETPVVEAAAELLVENETKSLIGRRLGHYEIVAMLGEGGMGAVCLARDTKLGRKVAVKLLPADVTADPDRVRRFKHEACTASSLNHPNILTIYEVGEAEGAHFIATEFIEGQTLRERVKDAPMDIDDIVSIGEQVVSALSAAHEAGIVHRDIKPENVMVRRDGFVKVLDFGLAKLIKPSEVSVDATTRALVQTKTGVVMGTVPYMSPEQALGREVDHRSDIFSFGVVLYEMATGQSPFAGANAVETLDRILHAQPEGMTRLNASVPPELERLILKCLEKEKDQRYQTTRELAIDLSNIRPGQAPSRNLSVGTQSRAKGAAAVVSDLVGRPGNLAAWSALGLVALVLLVVAGRAYWSSRRTPTTGGRPEIKSLAVLPLENLSGDPAQEYFADGMTESLISSLAQIRALKVISRTSVMRYKGSRQSLPDIARELNVDGIIEGSVQRAGGRVRVTTQLIHAGTDTHLWAREFERDLTDVLRLQGDVAREVAEEIRIQVTAEERARLTSARSVNPQAHEAYLLGRYHYSKGNETGWAAAAGYFEQAVQIAPDYAAAYAGLSDVWLQRGIFGTKDFKEAESNSRTAAWKALELDGELAEAHTSVGHIKFNYDWDWAGAEVEFKRALDLDPGGVREHISYGHFLMAMGRHDEAIREGRIAVQLDPLSSESYSALGRFLYRARRFEEALPYLQRAVELEPKSIAAQARLGQVYEQLGRYDEAIAIFGDKRGVGIAHLYALMGKKREARRMISGIRAQAPITLGLASVYVALGDKDQAFRILEKAVEERNDLLVYMKESPPLDGLHSDLRWAALLRRMNFPTG